MTEPKEIQQKRKFKEIPGREQTQWLMLLFLPLVVVGGYFYPLLGLLVVGFIIFFLFLNAKRGRQYCGWFCPMGSFQERVLTHFSLHLDILPVFKATWFRWLLFAAMMGLLGSRLFMAWGDAEAVGSVFRMMWILSTGLAIGIGIFFKPRTWCAVCPMATMQGVTSPNTHLLTVAPSCKECGLCKKACPIQTYPGAYKEAGQVPSIECMRCSNCVVNCPKKSLSFQDRPAVRAVRASRDQFRAI